MLSIFLVELNDVDRTRFCLFRLDALSCLILFAIDMGDTLVEPVLERPGVGGLRVCAGPSIDICVCTGLSSSSLYCDDCFVIGFSRACVVYYSC